MSRPDLIAPIITAAEKAGVKLIDEDKAQFEKMLEPLADADANAVVNAIADHIVLHGAAGMLQSPLRNALTGSESALDDVINQNVEGGIDSIESWLAGLAAHQ